MQNRERVIDELKKIKALADAGIDGEALAAAKLLQARLGKYGLTLEDISDPGNRTFYVRYYSPEDRRLVRQVAYSFGIDLFSVKVQNRKIKEFAVICTPSVWADFSTTLDVMRKAWEEELKVFFAAFVKSQNLFPSDGPVRDVAEMTPEERAAALRMLAMAGNIDRRQVQKRLE